MTAEQTIEQKAHAILTSGRLTVIEISPAYIAAMCTSSSDPATTYVVGRDLGGWRCSCPCPRGACSHVAALKLVTLASPRRSA